MSDELLSAHEPCPDCGSSDALSIYTDHTYCFSCQKTTIKKTLAKELTGTLKVRKKLSMIPFDEQETQRLSKRGISQKTCETYKYKIGEFYGQPVHIANYFDDEGNLIGQKLRFQDKSFVTIGKISDRLYGQNLWSNGKILVITEGEIDAMSVHQAGGNKYACVSIPNGAQSAKHALSANLRYLEGFEEVVLMFDMDEVGRAAVNECVSLFKPNTLKIANLPFKDANECLMNNQPDAIITAIFQAKPYRPDSIVNGDELWEQLENEPDEVEGYPLPFGDKFPLQVMTQGLRKGELVLITAGTGSGKTTFSRQLAHHMGVTLGLKVGLMMLEENIKRTAKGIMSVHCGKRLAVNRKLVNDDEYKQIFDETLGLGNFVMYNHFGSVENSNLINQIRYMVTAEGCDFIVLDHISITISGLDIADERKALDVMMTKLRMLVEELGFGLIVISHLKRIDGTPAEEGGIISLSHLRGSQVLSQTSDTVLALERNQQADVENEKNLVRLRLLKNRFLGETGLAGYLSYNKETDRLVPSEPPKKPKNNLGFEDNTHVEF